jgi:KDO2-lipid IV(A) lauroyltransferase
MGFLLWIFCRVPKPLANAFMIALAWIAFTLGIRRRVALENLAIAFPELSDRQRRALAWRNYRHLALCAVDFLRSPALSDADLFGMVDPVDWEKLEKIYASGQGLIGATAHFGNFEFLGVYAARRGVPLTILTRPLKGGANARWVNTRALAGIREIHRGMDNLLKAVKNGETLALLIDQNMLPRRSTFVPFFGKLAATTPAPAIVAARTGAPVVVVLMLRQPDGRYRSLIEGPFHFERRSERLDEDLRAFTAMLNERFERLVRNNPEQWFWVHRRWKTRPPEESAPAAAAADKLHEAQAS